MATPSHPHAVWNRDTPVQLFTRLRLLTKMRNAAVDMANTAEVQRGDGVSFNKRAFDRFIRATNQLMAFEDAHES